MQSGREMTGIKFSFEATYSLNMLKISAFSLMLTRENTDFSTDLMKYIWYSPKKSKYPLHIIWLTEKCFYVYGI